MSQATPIKATFSDFRLVKGRKCAQLVFEVPLEGADAALGSLGGLPRPDAERWFGIVALDLSKAASEAPDAPANQRKPFETLPAPQQAALRCNDTNFQRFLCEQGFLVTDAESAAVALRHRLNIDSRADLGASAAARAKWVGLDDEFFRWQRGMR